MSRSRWPPRSPEPWPRRPPIGSAGWRHSSRPSKHRKPRRARRDGIRAAGDALREALRGWDALLVLDNCEHLVEACARLAEALLRGCPRLRILATSREALGIGGERAWLVPALTLPDAGKP